MPLCACVHPADRFSRAYSSPSLRTARPQRATTLRRAPLLLLLQARRVPVLARRRRRATRTPRRQRLLQRLPGTARRARRTAAGSKRLAPSSSRPPLNARSWLLLSLSPPVRTPALLPTPGAVTYRPFVLLPACSGLPPSSSSSSCCTSPSLASPDPCMACFLFLFPCFPAFTSFHSSARTHVPSPPFIV